MVTIKTLCFSGEKIATYEQNSEELLYLARVGECWHSCALCEDRKGLHGAHCSGTIFRK